MADPEEKVTIDGTALALALCGIILVNTGLFLRFKTEVDTAITVGVVALGAACAIASFFRLRRAGK